MENQQQELIALLEDKATRLRIDSVRATTAAGSGHPTSCASAAEIVSVLFFSVMRYDPTNPGNRYNDVFILSKGHAAPILYAAWAEAGAFPINKLLTLRKLNSDLEGHPTPRLPFVEAATGSLGQGLSVGVGTALAERLDHLGQRTYVLMGDGETAEGSVWEAAQMAAFEKLGGLCAVVDVNGLGQSGPTEMQHDMHAHKVRWEGFGWNALTVDGHSIPELLKAFHDAGLDDQRPTVILARTLKGKDLLDVENKEGQHGKALSGEEAQKVIEYLESKLNKNPPQWMPQIPSQLGANGEPIEAATTEIPPYKLSHKAVAPRKAFGDALAALGKANPRVVVLDGDVKNSTYTDEFEQVCPERFFQGYIAEQNLVGCAMGLAARGKVSVFATFGSFLTRAYDFIRMAAIGGNNIKLAGTHVGVSIGEDGPSQMALEDIAMMCAQPNYTVLYPSDATSTWYATDLALRHDGPCYLRLGRPATPILYAENEQFAIGKCKVLRQNERDRLLIVTGGVTLSETLAAYDELKQEGIFVRVIDLFSLQPIDREALVLSGRAVGGLVITVEDHYLHGGLGDLVLSALAEERVEVHKLAIREIPHSGKPDELLDYYGISQRHIVLKVKSLLSAHA